VAQAKSLLAEQARRRHEHDATIAEERRHPPFHPAAA